MCCIHFSDTNSLSSVDNTTVWVLLQSPAVLSFYHYGVSSNVTHLICAWQIYPYMMFALYAGMLKTCVRPWKTRVSNNAENVKFKRAHPRVWQLHTVVGGRLKSTNTPEPWLLLTECLYVWREVQCVYYIWHIPKHQPPGMEYINPATVAAQLCSAQV